LQKNALHTETTRRKLEESLIGFQPPPPFALAPP